MEGPDVRFGSANRPSPVIGSHPGLVQQHTVTSNFTSPALLCETTGLEVPADLRKAISKIAGFLRVNRQRRLDRGDLLVQLVCGIRTLLAVALSFDLVLCFGLVARQNSERVIDAGQR